MTVQDGWDALEQIRDVLTRKVRENEPEDDPEGYQVFERGRKAGVRFVARNAQSWILDRGVSPMDGPDAERDGDGWDDLEDFQDFVRENYLLTASPGDVPDFKPGEKGFEQGKADEAERIVDDVDRVLQFEGPDSDDLRHENVDDPEQDPIITEDGRVLRLGRRSPEGLQDELEAMAENDVIDVPAEEIDVEADIEDMTDEPDSDDSDEELTDELRGEDPDEDNTPSALVDPEDEDDGDA